MKRHTQIRIGFTLVELLVVITIISMLAAITLGALSVVRHQSKVDQTKRTVKKVHFLLMEKLEEYQTKRIRVNNTSGCRPLQVTAARTALKHDLMRMEMPDRLSDVMDSPIGFPVDWFNSVTDSWVTNGKILQIPCPGACDGFSRRIERTLSTPLASLTATDCANMSAELLYMIVMRMPGAAEQFSESEIGDSNNNGLKEFVDAWGEPIRFLRWAPGLPPEYSDIQSYDPGDRFTPFDPYSHYRLLNSDDGCILYPLIFSSGSDKKHGVNVESGYRFQGNPYRHVNAKDAAKNNAGEPNAGAYCAQYALEGIFVLPADVGVNDGL